MSLAAVEKEVDAEAVGLRNQDRQRTVARMACSLLP